MTNYVFSVPDCAMNNFIVRSRVNMLHCLNMCFMSNDFSLMRYPIVQLTKLFIRLVLSCLNISCVTYRYF